MRNYLAALCIIAAGLIAAFGREGWGWFLLVAALFAA